MGTSPNSSQPTNDRWVVYDYEVGMWRDMCNLLCVNNPIFGNLCLSIKNAVVESAVLHTRILVDILLSRGKNLDDINLSNLVPSLQSTNVEKLRNAYGDGKQESTPCWEFNKMLAHATSHRSRSYDYSGALNSLRPLIDALVAEIATRRN